LTKPTFNDIVCGSLIIIFLLHPVCLTKLIGWRGEMDSPTFGGKKMSDTNNLPSDPTQSHWGWVIGGVVMVTLVITYALIGYQQDPTSVTERWQNLLTTLGIY